MATRGRGTPRECPVATGHGTCARTVRAGQLMCPPHWRRVPKDARDDVWATWRRWERTMTDDAWAAYTAARETALEAAR